MKRLWAPWRINYIRGEKPLGCILCDKPKQKSDRANLILLKGKHGFVMMNLYPYNNGHLMISPYQHTGSLEDLSNEVLKDLMQMMKRSLAALRKAFQPEGVNVGLNIGKAAGAGIDDHLHFHVVPRWEGDTNFMTVFSENRVIPEDLEETYRLLKPHFKGR
ncbi:MAG: HIT domain-containing protein [Nitrospiria bacterium]